MRRREYLLDANIVIKMWKAYPHILRDIEKREELDFKISRDIAEELSVKEFANFQGIQVLSDRFLELLDHIIDLDMTNIPETYTNDKNIKYDSKKNIYIINDNKISKGDFSLIYACEMNTEYILVTEDRRLLNSANYILGSSRVMSFNEFLEDIKSFQGIYTII